jgi:hypothetical protein
VVVDHGLAKLVDHGRAGKGHGRGGDALERLTSAVDDAVPNACVWLVWHEFVVSTWAVFGSGEQCIYFLRWRSCVVGSAAFPVRMNGTSIEKLSIVASKL